MRAATAADRPTDTISVTPSTTSAPRSTSLPSTKLGRSVGGISNTSASELRRAAKAPSPAYSSPAAPISVAAAAASRNVPSAMQPAAPSQLSRTIPGKASTSPDDSASRARGNTSATKPTTPNASASTGKNDRYAK